MKNIISTFLLLFFLLFSVTSILHAQSTGCENLTALADDLADPNFGDDLISFFDGLEPGKGYRAWEALSTTSLSKDSYWLSRVNRWQEAGLSFKFSQSGSTVKMLRNGIEVAEINDGLQYFKIVFKGFGGDIYCPLDRTVTAIGRLHKEVPFKGTWYLIEDLKLNKLTSIPAENLTQSNVPGLGNNPGGLNVLDVPPAPFYSRDLNKDWLYEAAVVRGDVIRILSDPEDLFTLWRDGIPPGNTGFKGQTRTKDEMDWLAEWGFIYDADIPGFRKP